MNAQEARDASEAARQQAAAARRIAEEQQEIVQDKAERDNYGFALADARKKIAEAVAEGKSDVFVSSNRYVSKALSADGYTVRLEFGTSNMDDSAAPCMVEWNALRVSW
jgi:hypothetical protein